MHAIYLSMVYHMLSNNFFYVHIIYIYIKKIHKILYFYGIIEVTAIKAYILIGLLIKADNTLLLSLIEATKKTTKYEYEYKIHKTECGS